ncbi:FadR/GntR family transcriptional regulator [Acuticoccus kandeliae]|uniref:FadR/GntR family transcriptional regulator n=1 Tax=Acuticoccus kandeliae TaxID=2073160 RepID=UPI000D3E4FDD|nr:FCD domain-containing protein [Acuticoccus kandeliae]
MADQIDTSQRKTGPSIARRLVEVLSELGIQPGDKIPVEADLCEMLDVSRPALREATSILEATGLLIARKGSGRVLMPMRFGHAMSFVSSYALPKRKWLLDLLSIRQVTESAMLPVSVPKLSEEDFAVLEAATAAMEEKAARGEHFVAEDRAFHRALYRPLDNEVLEGLLELFWEMYDKLNLDSLSHSQRLDETAAHHRRILDAVKAGDLRLAQHALNAHFYDTFFALRSLN